MPVHSITKQGFRYCNRGQQYNQSEMTYLTVRQILNSKNIPRSDDFDITKFLADDMLIGEWQQEGLPSDNLSTENAIMLSQSQRFPLLIDPQRYIHHCYCDSHKLIVKPKPG